MDLLKSSKRRAFLSELVYIVLNVGLAVAILAVVLAIESPLPAIALVLLSKWRVLAVRPRYWMANIKAPSPATHTTWRSGAAILAPIDAGRP